MTNTLGSNELDYRRATMGVLNRVRANATGNATGNAPHIVMFTGPFCNSGSTTTAFSIAYAAATIGDRVLLIDAASAQTRLSDAFVDSLPVRGPITLDNVADLNSIVTHDPLTGLAFLPIAMADLRMLKSAQRKRLQNGLEQLAKGYDLVVIDGGGVLEDESALIMLPFAREIILIARAGETQANSLTSAAQQLDRARDRITGVVLTSTADPA